MQVNLKRDFFGPDGVQYRMLDNPHDFDEGWKLPKDAEKVKKKSILDDDDEVVVKTTKK